MRLLLDPVHNIVVREQVLGPVNEYTTLLSTYSFLFTH